MQNLADYLLGLDFPEAQTRSFFEHKIYTLGDYRQTVEEIVNIFENNNFPKNVSAIMILQDAPLTLAMFLACIKYGIVPLLISTYTMDDLLDQAMTASDATILITDGSRDLSRFNNTLLIELKGNCAPGAFELKFTNSFNIESKFVDASEIAFFLMTSGSTGLPKIVVHVHEAMIFTTDVYAKDTLELSPDDIIYSAAKSSFGYGLANNLFFSFATGAPAVLFREDFSVELMFRYMEEYHPTVIFAIPSIYRMIISHLENNVADMKKLDSVRSYLSSGEKLSAELAKEWKEFIGSFLMDNMASSEASAILLNRGNVDKYGSAGKPVKGSEVFLLDADGNNSNEGILYFRSVGNAIGYYHNQEETDAHFENGCLKTGDIFRIDEDGYYWHIGREDNLLKYHGFWILPEEIERKIEAFGRVKRAVVFKVTVDDYDRMAAAVEVSSDFVGSEALRRFLLNDMDEYKCPQFIICYESLPVNDRGKVDLSVLRRAAEDSIRG
ncbi:MAG: AMP-binding protein [Anaerovoracaceae bacterium]